MAVETRNSENRPILRFNAGLLSPLALAREDLKRYAFSAEEQTNWMPRSLGSMMLRPGTEYISTTYNNTAVRFLPFVKASNDTALVELVDQAIRFWVNESVVSFVAVSTAVTNGHFSTDLSGWTDSDEVGAVSAWSSGNGMSLRGTGSNRAIREQHVTVSGGDVGKEHGLRINVKQGEVFLRIGSSAGGEQYLSEQVLTKGSYCFAITPTGNFYIWLAAVEKYPSYVSAVNVISSGTLGMECPYPTASLSKVRYDQSGDIIFCACDGYRPVEIRRYGAHSWAVVDFLPSDGPFGLINTTTNKLTVSARSGQVTLTSTRRLFTPSHVGALFRLRPPGQKVIETFTAEDLYTPHIIVSGVGDPARNLWIDITGTFTATVTLQVSYDEGATWQDDKTYTTATKAIYYDERDNITVWYRLGIKVGDFTSGSVVCSIQHASGSITGIARVVSYTDDKTVTAIMLKEAGNVTATADWYEGQWSDYRGYPTAVRFHDGRIVFAGRDKFNMSVSDAFRSFDDTLEGGNAAVARSIGAGPVDVINWMTSIHRLAIGGQGAEYFAYSSALDEPITNSNYNCKAQSTQGSASVDAVKIDNIAVFVQASGQRIFQVGYDPGTGQYQSEELTAFCPEVCASGVVRLAAQRQPDTRLHAVLSDGTVAIFVYSKFQEINCWVKFETDGAVEDVIILPGTEEDKVYYVVRRTVNGNTVRYLERFALESECIGGDLNKQADSFKIYNGAATGTLSGLSHLEGETVVVWGDGVSHGTKTVTGGAVTVSPAVSKAVVGLPYTARFKSAKLAWGAAIGSAMMQVKRVGKVGFLLHKTHAKGLKYGDSFDTLDELPGVENGEVVPATRIWDTYDFEHVEFDGIYETDPRVCLQASAPLPCTVLGISVTLKTSDKA